jgi:hypothetical protein
MFEIGLERDWKMFDIPSLVIKRLSLRFWY